MSHAIRTYFLQVEDFRQAGKCRYRLADILLIGLCTYLSNGHEYEDMVLFAQTRARQLADLVDLPSVLSHDTVNRVFQLLSPRCCSAVWPSTVTRCSTRWPRNKSAWMAKSCGV